MKTMNCRSVQRLIDDTGPGDLLGAAVSDHIRTCSACGQFSRDDVKLRGLMSSLGTVEAPGDFEFRLRARLAGEKHRNVSHGFGFFKPGFRAATLATVALIIVSGVFVASLRKTAPSAPPSDNQLAARESEQPVNLGKPGLQAVVSPTDTAAQEKQTGVTAKTPQRRRNVFTYNTVANGRLGTREMASRPATIMRPEELIAGRREFPIRASSQPLKVSVDDGRGSSRTISLPSVSFGSQRVLAQNTSPLLASARGDW